MGRGRKVRKKVDMLKKYIGFGYLIVMVCLGLYLHITLLGILSEDKIEYDKCTKITNSSQLNESIKGVSEILLFMEQYQRLTLLKIKVLMVNTYT